MEALKELVEYAALLAAFVGAIWLFARRRV